MSGPRPRVAIVILNWRAPDLTLRAVERVARQNAPWDRIFVVENGSGDDSAHRLKAGLAPYADGVVLLRNQENLGFGGGCNTALRAILDDDFDWVWLLNNDAEPDADCLAELLRSAQASPDVGMVGTRLRDPTGREPEHFGSWMNPITLVARPVIAKDDLNRRFSWLTAASLLVSVGALRRAGMFDERFFMYWEDADLNLRMRAAGFKVLAAPGARALHAAGTSSRGIEVRRYLWHFASQKLFLTKHHSAPGPARIWLKLKFLLKAVLDGDCERARALLSA